MNTSLLAIKQLDKQLVKWNLTRVWYRPKNGWIRTIRKALGMTTKQLAKILGVDRSRVIRIESDETKSVLTMKTLEMVANALNCDVVYALVPREPLYKMVKRQVDKIANQQLNNISHNMFLENQEIPKAQNKKQLMELRAKLLEKIPANLWNNDG